MCGKWVAMVGSGNVAKTHSLLHRDCYMKIHGVAVAQALKSFLTTVGGYKALSKDPGPSLGPRIHRGSTRHRKHTWLDKQMVQILAPALPT